MSEDAVGREAPMWFQKCVAGECGNSVGADMVWFYMVTPPTMAGVKNLLINNGNGSRSFFSLPFFLHFQSLAENSCWKCVQVI